jgi:hypothetical protein
MPDRVVRFPQGRRHGWYVGRDHLVALRPGDEARWPSIWRQYSIDTGQTLDDLEFADDRQRAEFGQDVAQGHR